MSMGVHRHCYVTFEIQGFVWEKTYRFCNLRKWKDFNKKKNSLPYLKCVLRLSCVVHGPIYGPFFHSLSCSMTPLHRERIKGRKSLQPFPSEAIDRTLAWTPHYCWKIATWPETQITHTRGRRQSLPPVDINTRERKHWEKETVSHPECE